MSALNSVFSKLGQFTGDGGFNLRQWLFSFKRCCVIADKDDDLVKGKILMMCISWRANAILDQFEAEKGNPQKCAALEAQRSTVCDSLADREARMTAFECRLHRLNENENEFMTSMPKSLPLQRYHGPGLLNANGTLITPCGVITSNLIIGHPTVCYVVDFLVVDSLPYSRIIGLSILNKLKKWGVDTALQTFFLDNSSIKLSHDPPLQDSLHLFTPGKYTIPPKKTLKVEVAAIANGIALHPFRPVSELP